MNKDDEDFIKSEAKRLWKAGIIEAQSLDEAIKEVKRLIEAGVL